MKKQLVLVMVASVAVVMACSRSDDFQTTVTPVPDELGFKQSSIKLNQVGFLPSEAKVAIVPDNGAGTFSLFNAYDNTLVFTGKLSPAKLWQPSEEVVRIADFSSFTQEGEYRLKVDHLNDSKIINISQSAYLAPHDAALKAYYFNRASSALLTEQAGLWARQKGHGDEHVLIHASAASSMRPEGTFISAPKGWYDAGDYNKYMVNSGISVYTLLLAYEHYPLFYRERDIGIPESADSTPDILDEVKWNLDWMMAMQDPNDGGVYHKLTTLDFSASVMPHQATELRYVVQKSTAAALNFSATMAMASRIYAEFPHYVNLAREFRSAAELAWQWAQKHPNVIYVQPNDVFTGEYGDSVLTDEFSWAAAELFLLTDDQTYLDYFKHINIQPSLPSWSNSAALAYISLLNHKTSLNAEDYELLLDRYLLLADEMVSVHQRSAYAVAMQNADFVWGSNAVALNKALVLIQAERLTGDNKYQHVATGLLDYVLGRNPTDYSYLTGFGVNTPMDIHHRQSHADNIVEPVAGFLVGGAQPGQQDDCIYPSHLPAKSYLDDWCSYSTNEVTINWNAPLVYVLASLHAMQ